MAYGSYTLQLNTGASMVVPTQWLFQNMTLKKCQTHPVQMKRQKYTALLPAMHEVGYRLGL